MNDIVNNWLLLTREVIHFEGLFDYANKSRGADLNFSPPRRRLTCKSGLLLSIQASETHYCSPRNDEGPYTAVELMLFDAPKIVREAFSEHISGDGGVYAWVPIELVNQVIEDNGGIDLTKEKEHEG